MEYEVISSDIQLSKHYSANTSFRCGASGAPKNVGPRPNSPPRPAERPGAGLVF